MGEGGAAITTLQFFALLNVKPKTKEQDIFNNQNTDQLAKVRGSLNYCCVDTEEGCITESYDNCTVLVNNYCLCCLYILMEFPLEMGQCFLRGDHLGIKSQFPF